MTQIEKLPLKVVNFWAGPGAGKSTTAAGLFNLMKNLHLSVELVTEYAKDAVYQEDSTALDNQLWLLANQDMRLRRLVGKVEWAITDSPLPLCLTYAGPEYKPFLEIAAIGAYRRYMNYNFLVLRAKAYQTFGRRESEEEAQKKDSQVESLFWDIAKKSNPISSQNLVTGDETAPGQVARSLGLTLL